MKVKAITAPAIALCAMLAAADGPRPAPPTIPGWPGEIVRSGVGEDENRWYSDPIPVVPGASYALSFEMKMSGSGIAVAGTDSVNKDFSGAMREWTPKRIVFRARTDRKTERIHFGQWKLNGTVAFRRPRLEKVKSIHCAGEDEHLVLGAGEQMDGGMYRFTAGLSGSACNDSRPLFSARRVTYNSISWVFGKGSEVVYRHAMPGRKMATGAIRIDCCSYKKGSLAVAVSVDGVEWTGVGAVTNLSEFSFAVPAGLLPADAVYVRMLSVGEVNLQVSSYSFDGGIVGDVMWANGTTRYVSETTGEDLGGSVRSCYFDEDYGETVAFGAQSVVWRASSGRKIPPRRKVPAARAAAIEIKTAANEAEAAQLVFTPRRAVEDVRVSLAGDLRAEGGASMAASAVDLLRVGYVEIQQTTDTIGTRGLWPDPLPPQDSTPLAVGAGSCQPFWIRVKPPKGTPKGVYRGIVEVVASFKGGGSERIPVPLEVEVFGFNLPDRMTCRTGFRCDMRDPWRYHAAKTPEERRKVADSYFAAIAACHISPYDPVPGVKWSVGLKDGKVEFDWKDWDAAIEKAVAERHINTIKISLQGLGGGSFHSRREPSFMGVPATNEAYHALMAQYLGGMERHFREKGWLDMVWTFWFDEPAAKDYPFVMEGFRLLRRHAPGMQHMLTEQPEPELYGGPNLWCGIPSEMDLSRVAERREAGDRIWWYLCVSPKAPYVGLFTDHPSNELRMWLWQTWGEGISGILSWNTCFWTSPAAYPEEPQNPYLDPMSWMYSYGLPKGSRRPWGNGDGRLFYPPIALADGKAEKFTEGAPVASFRSEGLRDGIEDYEYFSMLKRLDPHSPLLKVPVDVYRSLTDFSTDPSHIEAHRLKLARAIEAFSRTCP